MVPSSAASTTNQEEATTMKFQPQQQVDEEDKRNEQIIIPPALQWIMAASSSSPATLTIEEVNRKAGVRPAGLWFCVVYMLAVFVGLTWFLAYELPRKNDPDFLIISTPWWQPATVAWGVYMALVMESFFFMSLLLPRAPAALREAVVNVGVACISVPLGVIAFTVACVGYTWMCVVVACVFAALFAAIIALWVWLVRTYYYYV